MPGHRPGIPFPGSRCWGARRPPCGTRGTAPRPLPVSPGRASVSWRASRRRDLCHAARASSRSSPFLTMLGGEATLDGQPCERPSLPYGVVAPRLAPSLSGCDGDSVGSASRVLGLVVVHAPHVLIEGGQRGQGPPTHGGTDGTRRWSNP